MTTEEFSNGFDTLVDSYRRFKDFDKREELDSIEFDEYQKSLYLTLAQDELVANLYSGKNIYGDAFESTEEMRRYLDELVKTESPSTTTGSGVSDNSVFYALPNDVAYIVYERVKLNDSSLGCYTGEIANVYPVTHDEYNRIRRNPFRGPTKYKVLRLDCGENVVELVSKYSFNGYLIRYIAQPEPIILEELWDGFSSGSGSGSGDGSGTVTIKNKHEKTGCALNPALHDTILKRAVQMALASKGIKATN